MEINTTVSSQNVNDVMKMIDKQYPPQLEQDEKIKIAIAFGQALSNHKLQESIEYYEFLKQFEEHIPKLI